MVHLSDMSHWINGSLVTQQVGNGNSGVSGTAVFFDHLSVVSGDGVPGDGTQYGNFVWFHESELVVSSGLEPDSKIAINPVL